MKLRNWKRIMIMAASLAVLSARGGQAGAAADGAPPAAEADYFWRLGVGTYGTPGPRADEDTLLTHARFDWQMIAFGSGVDMPTINRCLELNPRQRFLVRLWPRRGGDNFLKYLYTPAAKERIDRTLRDQVREVLDEILRPDQVIAFTFLEELPDRWHPFYRHKSDDEILGILEPYREAIEKDLGRPLVIDDETKAWLWEKFAESMDRVHAAIRAEAGDDRLILFWGRFDWFNVPMLQRIVKQGPADGVFIYVLKPGRWQEHVRVAEENGWPFFSQLSHNTGMKQADWKSCAELAHIQSPYNLGYFFFGGGNPLRPHFFDNPAVDPVNNVSGFSGPVHLRWFAGDRDLGWDVFKRHLRFRPLLDFRPTGKGVGDTVDLYAVIPNPILEGHYPSEADQGISGVTATLSVPGWLKIASAGEAGEPEEPAATAIRLGSLGSSRHRAPTPDSFAVAHWRLCVVGPPSERQPLTVAVKGEHPRLGTIEGGASVTGAVACVLAAGEERQVLVSGQGWAEPGFGLDGDITPTIVLRTGNRPAPNPSLTDGEIPVAVSLGTYKDNAGFYRLLPQAPAGAGVNRVVYNGTIPPNSTLVIGADCRATLAPTRPLLEKVFASEAEPGPGAAAGYYQGAHGVNRPIPAGETVVIEIAGKREGQANTLVIPYFRCADTGEKKSTGAVLVNGFRDEWRTASAEIVPPFTNAVLESIALYRYPNGATGTVWYGSLKADLSLPPDEAEDVTDRVEGAMPALRAGRYNLITYFDEDTQQPQGSKVNVQLTVPAAREQPVETHRNQSKPIDN